MLSELKSPQFFSLYLKARNILGQTEWLQNIVIEISTTRPY